jgi:hypothetical protein
MRKGCQFLFIAGTITLFLFNSVTAQTLEQTYSTPALPGYKWRVELSGPTKHCKVPAQFVFVVADAVIKGKVTFQNKTYWPQGRMEDSFDTELELIRFYGDPKPLVSIKANHTGVGSWKAHQHNCMGIARVVPRSNGG